MVDSSSPQHQIRTLSPGKCLISGGYLILNPKYKGLVVTTDTYFTCEGCAVPLNSQDTNGIFLQAYSAHFDKTYSYFIKVNTIDYNIAVCIEKEPKSDDNCFIMSSALNAFYFYLSSLNIDAIDRIIQFFKKNSIQVNLTSDYRFYSYNHNNQNNQLKTGLGSSSALVTSLTSNLVLLLHTIANNSYEEHISIRDIQRDLQVLILISAYSANNMAQNKIGSGFDIQACLLGSQIFTRPSFPNFYQKSLDSQTLFADDQTMAVFRDFLEEFSINYFGSIRYLKPFPTYLKTALISIEAGSDTRIFVGNVMKWADANKQKEIFDDELFQNLNAVNEEMISLVSNKLSECEELCDFLGNQMNIKLKLLCKSMRTHIKEISKSSNVEIEPDLLSTLMDILLEFDEICMAICPGAGGYDGIFVMGYGDTFHESLASGVERYNSMNFSMKASIINLQLTFSGTWIKY